jgi:ABC-2 type transport system permease protein
MTATTPASAAGTTSQVHRVGFAHLLRAEWTKLRSVRSTRWTLTVMGLLTLGMSVLVTTLAAADWDAWAQDALGDPTGLILQPGAAYGVIVVSVLGVIVIASEYSTGTIQPSTLAVPRRTPMLAAKAAVFGVLVFCVAGLIAFLAFLVGQAILRDHVQVSLGDPGVLRAVVGLGLYFAVMGLLALAVGTLVRHLAGAITLSLGLTLVLPVLLSSSSPVTTLLPGRLGEYASAYAPVNAGQALLSSGRDPGALLSPWQGFAVLCLWAALGLTVAAYVLTRRDT